MSAATRARPIRAPPFLDPPGYARHRPEATLLCRLVEQHYPAFRALRSEAGRPLPEYIEQEFDASEVRPLGRRLPASALRFLLATNPAALTQVLGVVYRTISGYLLKSAGLTRTSGQAGAVTLIQRFGSALNLNIHFHMLLLDGVYLIDEAGQAVFCHVPEPGVQDLQILVEQIAQRIGRTLERCGLIERCARCAGRLRIIASIEEPEVIAKILAHLEKTAPDQHQSELPLGARAPPSQARLP